MPSLNEEEQAIARDLFQVWRFSVLNPPLVPTKEALKKIVQEALKEEPLQKKQSKRVSYETRKRGLKNTTTDDTFVPGRENGNQRVTKQPPLKKRCAPSLNTARWTAGSCDWCLATLAPMWRKGFPFTENTVKDHKADEEPQENERVYESLCNACGLIYDRLHFRKLFSPIDLKAGLVNGAMIERLTRNLIMCYGVSQQFVEDSLKDETMENHRINTPGVKRNAELKAACLKKSSGTTDLEQPKILESTKIATNDMHFFRCPNTTPVTQGDTVSVDSKGMDSLAGSLQDVDHFPCVAGVNGIS